MNADKGPQQQLEEAIEWLAFNRGKVLLGIIALLVISVTGGIVSRYLWQAFATSGQVPLEGRVLLDDDLVRYGTVTLLTEHNGVLQATIGADGTYRFDHVPAGRFRVAVSSPNPRSVLERQPTLQAPGPKRSTRQDRPPQRQPPTDESPAEQLGATAVAMPVTAATPERRSLTSRQQHWFPLPGHYANPATSGLLVNTAATQDRQDLRLTRPAPAPASSNSPRRQAEQ